MIFLWIFCGFVFLTTSVTAAASTTAGATTATAVSTE